MIIPKNIKNQMKSTRLHLAKGIKLIQRLLKEQASFFASLMRVLFFVSRKGV